KELSLPLASPPTKEEFESRAQRPNAAGYHAKVQLERLARGEKLQAIVDFRIQTWTFGDSLGIVFLPGEVVVDYSKRLKRELDCGRLWINAYSNDVPCYIPSERILKEGRYEGADAMIYYDKPGPFAPGLEQPIVDAVKMLLGDKFAAPH